MIVAINGKEVGDSREVARTISALPPATSVKLTVTRKGQEKTVNIVLGNLPDQREYGLPRRNASRAAWAASAMLSPAGRPSWRASSASAGLISSGCADGTHQTLKNAAEAYDKARVDAQPGGTALAGLNAEVLSGN